MAKNSERSLNGKRRRGPGRPWKKGDPSPNPRGRPKIPAEHKAALKMLDPMAAQAAGEILADATHKDRARLVEAVWNRNHGMPKQRVEQSGPDGGPIAIKADLTSEEKRAKLAALLAAGAARLAGGKKDTAGEG